jgi:hypothetical protein
MIHRLFFLLFSTCGKTLPCKNFRITYTLLRRKGFKDSRTRRGNRESHLFIYFIYALERVIRWIFIKREFRLWNDRLLDISSREIAIEFPSNQWHIISINRRYKYSQNANYIFDCSWRIEMSCLESENHRCIRLSTMACYTRQKLVYPLSVSLSLSRTQYRRLAVFPLFGVQHRTR